MTAKKQLRILPVLMIAILGLLAVTAVLAQTSASYDLSWHVTGSGGGNSSSSSYRVEGTIGQSVASPPQASSSSFRVSSGYWLMDLVWDQYLPVIKNQTQPD